MRQFSVRWWKTPESDDEKLERAEQQFTKKAHESCPRCGGRMENFPCPENRPGCIVHHGSHCLDCGLVPELTMASNVVYSNRRTGFKLSKTLE